MSISRNEGVLLGKWDHFWAVLLLPVATTLLPPLFIILITKESILLWFQSLPVNVLSIVAGSWTIGIGLILLYKTIQLFSTLGNGTLAPWNPPKRLVVDGIYRHVRNPMILGVLIIVLGEAILLGSIFIFLWFIIFGVGNHIYFIKREEPELAARFGEEYLIYKKNVPRWIPRLKPWTGNEENYTEGKSTIKEAVKLEK